MAVITRSIFIIATALASTTTTIVIRLLICVIITTTTVVVIITISSIAAMFSYPDHCYCHYCCGDSCDLRWLPLAL